MKRLLSLVFIICFLGMSLSAQIIDPVSWSASVSLDSASGKGTIEITADIQQGFHIYGTKKTDNGPVPTSFDFEGNDIVFDGQPAPSVKPNRAFNDMFKLYLEDFSGTVVFSQDFKIKPGASANVLCKVTYMACNDKACLPAKTVTLEIPVGSNPPAAPASDEMAGADNGSSASNDDATSAENNESDWWAPVKDIKVTGADSLTGDTSWWSLLLMGFLGGLLALLTPCVWPMIPMTVSFFLKKSKKRSRSILDASLYGLSIIVIFLVLGIAITLAFGAGKLNEIATSAFFNVLFFLILVVFAISFFGAFDIKLPSKWSNSIDNKAESTTGLLSIFFMAFTLVLVSFSCTGPIIGTLLVEAASNGSILGPALGMGGFALGLALPFSLFAFFPSILKEMPRSGGWMNSVKVVLGFIELILSLKFLSVADLAYGWRILDREVFIAIWIVLFTLLGIYLLGKLRFSHDSEKQHTSVGGFFLAVASFSFAVYLLPGMWGAPLKAVSAFAPPLQTLDFNLYGGEFEEFSDFDEGMAYARKHGKPVFIDFSGYACVNCRKMEGAVFDKEEVRKALEKDYVMIKLMVDDKTELPEPITVTENGEKVVLKTVGDRWAYLQRHKFNINSQPYYALLDNNGQLLNAPRVYDEDVQAFVEWLAEGMNAYTKLKDK